MGDKNISFGSFNLYNLQVPDEAVYGDSDGWDQGIYVEKVSWSGEMLNRIAADVVGFQELWAEKALSDVLRKAGIGSPEPCGTHKALVRDPQGARAARTPREPHCERRRRPMRHLRG